MIKEKYSDMSIVEAIQKNAEKFPNKPSLTYTNFGKSVNYNNRELLDQILRYASYLKNELNTNDRVLIMLENSSEYIIAFLACIYARVVAVPAYPIGMGRSHNLNRLKTVINDCSAAAVIASDNDLKSLKSNNELSEIALLSPPQNIDLSTYSILSEIPEIKENDTIFIMYTSGSTSNPKGVVVKDKNIKHNISMLDRAAIYSDLTIVSWLPLYHDLGLIASFLFAIYRGNHFVLMNSYEFIVNPKSWLIEISKHKNVFTCAPNFAFDLCVRKIKNDMLMDIDLSNLKILVNAAEPIKKSTLIEFEQKFSSSGFNPKAWLPAYGLAEVVVFACGMSPKESYRCLSLNRKKLEKNKVSIEKINTENTDRIYFETVSVGYVEDYPSIKIFNEVEKTVAGKNELGEIIISNDSVVDSYWKEPIPILNIDGKIYHRTGDIGFIESGYLYITGRKKEMIIQNGRNIYPQDVETEIQSCVENIRIGCGAVFSDDEDEIIFVQEVSKKALEIDSLAVSNIVESIKSIGNQSFGINFKEILLVRPGSVPKTSSGKIQRIKSKSIWEKNRFDLVSCG